MPRISIVMPVYNGEKYLRESIDSILAQTFTDWEFIIINEYGSNDAATAILQEYALKDKRIVLVQNERRLGIAASMNIGLDFANGEYIARMDADDISLPLRLEKQIEFMDSHPEIGISGIKPEVFGEEHWEWNAEADTRQVKAEILFFLPLLHPTAMMRKSVLDKAHLRYNPQYNCSEDYDLFARASAYCEISNIVDIPLFRYRRYPTAATYKNQTRGDEICKDVMEQLFTRMGLNFSRDEISLLYLHTGLKGLTGEPLVKEMTRLDLLLKKILQANMARECYGMKELSLTLHKRWVHAYEAVICHSYGGDGKIDRKVKEVYERSIFYKDCFYRDYQGQINNSPMVSVLMPVYNGQNYLYEAIYSICAQTYQNWELVIVNDGSSDESVRIINEYQKHDMRIKLYTNEQNLRISKTLNKGIQLSKGKYIARMDDDDISLPERLEKQVSFLEKHLDISLLGTFQRHFGNYDWVHMPPVSPDEMKASLLFSCEVCHSTIMMRKSDFVENDLWYNPTKISEDYELWTRASQKLKFATLAEILGEYRVNGENITAGKTEKLDAEARDVTAGLLKQNLHMDVAEEDKILLAAWTNPFSCEENKELLQRELRFLDKIAKQNNIYHAYEQSALEKILKKRKSWAKGENYIELAKVALKSNMSFSEVVKKAFKKILMPLYRPFRSRFDQLRQQLWDMDGHVCDVKETVRQHDLALQNSLDRIDYLEKSLTELSGLAQKIDEDTEFGAFDKRISKGENNILQTIDDGIKDTESNILKTMDGRIQEAESNILKTMDGRIQEAEGNILKTMDGRNREMESNILKTMDGRIWKSEENILKTMDGRIWEAEQNNIKNFSLIDYTKELARIGSLEKNEAKIFIFGTPFHSNIGDQAQAYCINEWCKKNYPHHTVFELQSASDDRFNFYLILFAIKEKLSPNDKIFVHSGYHTTDLYYNEQILILAVLQVFHEQPIVMFPQSIFFEDEEKLQLVANIYNSHNNLLFMARDHISYKIAKREFHHAKVLAYPDIVHSLIGRYNPQNGYSRQGVLFCKRKNDKETLYSEEDTANLVTALEMKYSKITYTDTTLKESCNEIEANRKLYIDRIVDEYSKYQVVITDRMHGVILSLAANTPVIVLKAKGPKVAANLQWYQKLEAFKGYVYSCDDLADVEKTVDHIMSLNLDYKLPPYFAEEYYDNLKELIESEIQQ